MKPSLVHVILVMLVVSTLPAFATAQIGVIGDDVGYYYITSNPSNAGVNFDGTYRGTTPVTVDVYSTATPGHTLIVSKTGYQTVTRSLSGNPPAGSTVDINVYLEPIPTPTPTMTLPGSTVGYFEISSVPSGASVTFDGNSYGTTPVTVEVHTTATPRHTLELTLSGYQTYYQTINQNPPADTTVPIIAYLTPSPSVGSIYVSSSPSGATAILDGSESRTTPASFGGVSPGSHSLTVSYPGYQQFYQYVTVTAGQTTNVYAALTPSQNTGTLVVNSNPSGAGVYIDEGYRGETPVSIGNLVQGSHSVRLRLAGYQDYSTTVVIYPGQVTTINPALTPSVNPQNGYILVSSTPAGASIYLDGSYQGKTSSGTQYDITGVSPGTHSVVLKLSGYQDYSSTVTVSAGQIVTINPTLTPSSQPSTTGSIQVSSSPTSAETYLDNVFQGYTPLTLQNVAPGSHVVLLKESGYSDWQTTTQVSAGQVTQLSATLSPVPTTAPTKSGGMPVAVIGALACILLIFGRRHL